MYPLEAFRRPTQMTLKLTRSDAKACTPASPPALSTVIVSSPPSLLKLPNKTPTTAVTPTFHRAEQLTASTTPRRIQSHRLGIILSHRNIAAIRAIRPQCVYLGRRGFDVCDLDVSPAAFGVSRSRDGEGGRAICCEVANLTVHRSVEVGCAVDRECRTIVTLRSNDACGSLKETHKRREMGKEAPDKGNFHTHT